MRPWDAFAYPWLLLLLVAVVPPIWWSHLRRGRRATIAFSHVEPLVRLGDGWSLRARHSIPLLRTLAVVLLVVCVARPRRADEMTKVKTEGVAIQLIVDRSPSMSADDLQDPRGRKRTRLQVVKDVVRSFIQGNGEELEGREDDLIGLTSFARYPDTECPLTWDHDPLLRALKKMRAAAPRSDEDGTAIGDALLLGVERIRNIGRRLHGDKDFKIKSRVIILLTDGQQTYGVHTPQEAAAPAKALGIKVYTIGAAPLLETVGTGFFGSVTRPSPIDEEALKFVARETGGKYYRATDAGSLAAIYAEIDALERSEIEEQRYYVYDELANEWIQWAGVSWPPPLMVALVLLGVEVLLVNTRFRRVP